MTIISDTMLQSLMEDMRQAGEAEVLPRFLGVTAEGIRAKTVPDDIVTDADLGAERRLSAALASHFPEALIVGEEAVSADPTLLDRLADAELAAIIDPVDGTWNFAHGVPLFGMIVAIVSGGETVAGLIHYPLTGDFLVARPDGGAWHIARDGERTRLSVAAAVPVGEMSGFVPLHMFSAQEQAAFAPRVLRFGRTTTWRCSAFEYRMVATGAMTFSLNADMKPWDHAAGELIHREAGGYSGLLSGEPYRPAMTQGRLLLAPDAASWEAIRESLG
ncbi:inositol monophosphatase family protein [Neorhizobium galegae]|uniref:inositol monophosphatase family protein n=1 Tax=Neorhizobium galegae TaxID=399 RepID=UPI000622ABA8|nr:inositol monophosphatase [Neorhizobium galegae]KAB1125996.1 inositol monophosphatase [Neorhizobium galegae]MCQ1804949.1 inositol monophosphatase [Neorhizobium galegae]CDZ55673.1 Inositol monophosphatase [Neorhizobium galegae bv. orientalis]